MMCRSTAALLIVAAFAAAGTLGGVVVRGQAGAVNGEWRTYGGDLGHTRYAPLDQINAANFDQPRGRLALQDRQPRPASGVSISSRRR